MLDQGNSLSKGCHVLGEFFNAAYFTPSCLVQVGLCGPLLAKPFWSLEYVLRRGPCQQPKGECFQNTGN